MTWSSFMPPTAIVLADCRCGHAQHAERCACRCDKYEPASPARIHHETYYGLPLEKLRSDER